MDNEQVLELMNLLYAMQITQLEILEELKKSSSPVRVTVKDLEGSCGT